MECRNFPVQKWQQTRKRGREEGCVRCACKNWPSAAGIVKCKEISFRTLVSQSSYKIVRDGGDCCKLGWRNQPAQFLHTTNYVRTLHSRSIDPSIVNDSNYVSCHIAFLWVPGNADMFGKLHQWPGVARCDQILLLCDQLLLYANLYFK